MKENVYFEPLINQWYAWPYLIPPMTTARHIVNTHKRIMTSFIKNYKLHILANNNPELAGSDFLNCTVEQLDDIKRLVSDIDENLDDMVELSAAIDELDELLRNHTSGESIEGLYAQVPQRLKGYVELVMDLNHNPSFRIIEGLMYRSPYYKRSLQTLSFGILEDSSARPFVFCTPRLADSKHLQLDADFNHPILDKLARSRLEPLNEEEIRNMFNSVKMTGGLNFMDLFTECAPKDLATPVETGVRIEYLGHAGFLIETRNSAILVDPVIANPVAEHDGKIMSFAQLPAEIDYICLTHSHQDHINLETL